MGPVLGGSWGTGTALWAGRDTSDVVWLVHVAEQVQEAVPKYLEALPVFLCGIESCRFCSTAQHSRNNAGIYWIIPMWKWYIAITLLC